VGGEGGVSNSHGQFNKLAAPREEMMAHATFVNKREAKHPPVESVCAEQPRALLRTSERRLSHLPCELRRSSVSNVRLVIDHLSNEILVGVPLVVPGRVVGCGWVSVGVSVLGGGG
jgi:hypothetical protein